MKKWRPGEQAPKNGYYTPYDKNGNTDGESTKLKKGQRFPATQHEGSYHTEEQE